MNLEDKVLEIMREVFEMENVTTDASQKNGERWDWWHPLALASELEEAFDIDLEPEEIADMTDFSRVIALLETKVK